MSSIIATLSECTSPLNSAPIPELKRTLSEDEENILGYGTAAEKATRALSIYPYHGRKTKIICTIGPATQSVEKIKQLLKAGMNVARLNFSHGSHEYHATTIANVRKASEETGILCAILLDTKGPEIRTGNLVDGKDIVLQMNQELELVCTNDPTFLGDSTRIQVDYPNLPNVVKVGGFVKFADGLVKCRIERISGTSVFVTVLNSGKMGQKKGTNLPGVKVDLPAVTEKDKEDLIFGVKQGVDFIAASFIRDAAGVLEIRKVLQEAGDEKKRIKIISKIENMQGLEHFGKILEVSDGIMVARGDLGVEVPIQEVCMYQKQMIRQCNIAGKPVITATQMLESMKENPRPTRAEATDVANAVFDGSDCVMLSAETAAGDYPIESVKTMARICITSEHFLDYRSFFTSMMLSTESLDRTEAITSCAVKTAMDLKTPMMVVLSSWGIAARFVSKYSPPVQVLALTHEAQTARQCLVSRALVPVIHNKTSVEEAFQYAMDMAKENGWAAVGEDLVFVGGTTHGQSSGATNVLKVLTVK